MTELIFNYMLRPEETLSQHNNELPRRAFWLVISLLALGTLLQPSTTGFLQGFTLFLLANCSIVFFVLLQSLCFDFSAQAMGYEAQSLRLFFWLGISHMPFLLYLPLDTVFSAMGPSGRIFSMLFFPLLFLIYLWLQVQTIRHLYRCSLGKAIWIYFQPLVFIFMPLLVLGGLLSQWA